MKPQWKATIDFKWIRDNKEAVSANIINRNSNANLELVLHLYEKMLNVQKVRFLFNQKSPVLLMHFCLRFMLIVFEL